MTPGQVGIYLCGLTVQSPPHIGHLRSAVSYDVLRRWLLHTGLEVTFIRNVTDVDDKIIDKSEAEGRPFWAIAYENRLIWPPPTPRSTCCRDLRAAGHRHITDMHELIATLIAKARRTVGRRQRRRVFRRAADPDYGSLRAEPGRHARARQWWRAGQA